MVNSKSPSAAASAASRPTGPAPRMAMRGAGVARLAAPASLLVCAVDHMTVLSVRSSEAGRGALGGGQDLKAGGPPAGEEGLGELLGQAGRAHLGRHRPLIVAKRQQLDVDPAPSAESAALAGSGALAGSVAGAAPRGALAARRHQSAPDVR